jgi:hypothetical protein
LILAWRRCIVNGLVGGPIYHAFVVVGRGL